jgi:hypothetical protein
MNVILATSDGSIPKASVFFNGCNKIESLGQSPSGSLTITQIKTQEAIRDSSTFEIFVYKDKLKTKLIAQLADGVRISSAQLIPGIITGITISADDTRVQSETNVHVTFIISHTLYEFAALEIQMPSGFTLPSAGEKVEVQSDNTLATEATILPGNVIQIVDLVGAGQTKAEGSVFELTISRIQNQNSVRDAGNWEITTMNRDDG